MELPTRIVENDEYAMLRELELDQHGFFRVLSLDAMLFNPPTEGNDAPRSVRTDHVHIQFVNIKEPSIYIKKDGGKRVPIVLLPKYDGYGYADMAVLHPNKKAWAYILAPDGWNVSAAGHDMDDAMWFFPDDRDRFIWL